MFTQTRFNRHGVETRKQTGNKIRGFEGVLALERQHASLVEALDVRLTPAFSAIARRYPQRYIAKYRGTDWACSLADIELVSEVKLLLQPIS